MKTTLILGILGLLCPALSPAQNNGNLFIITTDGFRWQEVFKGADSTLISDTGYTSDTSIMKQLYWDESLEERRKKLMPFFWNVIVREGQLYGNREFSNKVEVKNFYKISYPGYNELLSGYADPLPVLNTPTFNRDRNILEHFNKERNFSDQVVAFSSWYIFPFVINTKRNHILVNSGYHTMSEMDSDSSEKIKEVQLSVDNRPKTRFDLLTFLTAKDYLQVHHPKLVFLSFGETDEFAHRQKYDMYLQRANDFDKMIADLWYFVQTDPFYKNNTTFIITTDHGRGSQPHQWANHGMFTKGSGEIWMAFLGKNVARAGEMKNDQLVYQNQLAATIGKLLDNSFKPSKKMGRAIDLPLLPVPATNSFQNLTAVKQ